MGAFTLGMTDEISARSLGSWQVVGRSGVVGMHAALLHTGQVLFFARHEEPSHKLNTGDNGLQGDAMHLPTQPDVTLSTILETSGANRYIPMPVQVQHNPFCSGHTFLADGRLLVAGGDKKYHPEPKAVPEESRYGGLNSLRVFTPCTSGPGEWKYIGEISDSRWYPTCTLLPDGRVFVISGSMDDQEFEYNHQNPTCETIPPMRDGPQYLPLLVEAWPYHSYPFVFVLPAGFLFVFVKDSSYYFHLDKDKCGRERWIVENGPKLQGAPAKQYPNNATAVLLPLLPNDDPEKSYMPEVLLIGGAGKNVYNHFANTIIPDIGYNTHEIEALDNCFRLNVQPSSSRREWRATASMANARVMPDAVLLPDASVLVVNGVRRGFAGGNPATGPVIPEHAVREAELYDPVKEEWHTLATAMCTRLYHSTALLLPDARVLVAGSDHQVNVDRPPTDEKGDDRTKHVALGYEYRVEVFSPPYLFQDVPRPVIEEVEKRVAYGQRFRMKVPDLPRMKADELKAAFLSPGSVTHNNNMSQRHVGLRILCKSDTHLTLEAPPNGHIAPPGYYMLFLLYRGVPSEAQFVQLLLEPSRQGFSVGPPTAGMALWLRADMGVIADCNGFVSSWFDLSGRGNDVFFRHNTDPEARHRIPKLVPKELNGQAVVRFSVEAYWGKLWGGYLESTNRSFLPGRGPYAVFLVTHPWPSGPKGRGGLIGWGGSNASHPDTVVGLRLEPGPRSDYPGATQLFVNYLPKHPGKTSIVTYWTEGKRIGTGDEAPVSLSRHALLETSFDGGNWQMRLNGDLVGGPEPVSGKNTGNGPLTIGRNGGHGDFFRGDIAEIIVYERALNDAERSVVQEYCRIRYGLWGVEA